MKYIYSILITLVGCFAQAQDYSYDAIIKGRTLSVFVSSVDKVLGVVQINGVDLKAPTTPFRFEWGDGSISNGFFPINHSYTDKTKNYKVSITANYADGTTDKVEVIVSFISTSLVFPSIRFPNTIAVTIPTEVNLEPKRFLYSAPTTIVPFKESDIGTTPKQIIQYIMDISAATQYDFLNRNVLKVNDKFNQAIFLDPSRNGGGYSIWWTEPVGFAMGKISDNTIPYSSFFHEMGHNFTLNTPSSYTAGGKIDGNANAIYSESLAQIFQHATGYEILNNIENYGINDDIAEAIKRDVNGTFSFAKSQYDKYLADGKKYSSWNDPNTPIDETFGTFLTIGYKFIEYGNTYHTGYRLPTQRMMKFIQNTFDDETRGKYDQNNNTDAANKFRATYMVAAISAGYGRDFRQDFRTLNFPIDDEIYLQLMQKANLPVWVGINNIVSLKLCVNTTSNINTLTLGGTPKNKYIIELSDDNGNFNLPLKVGKVNTDTHQSSLKIPANIPVGRHYRLRIVAEDRSFSNEFPFDINVNSISVPKIQLPSSTIICKDSAIVLSVENLSGYTYQWQKDGKNISEATALDYKATQAGSYGIVANAYGCNITSQTVLLQSSNLAIQITATMASICPNDTVKIQTAISGNTPVLQWKLNNENLLGETKNTLITLKTGTYTLVANAEGCQAVSNNLAIKSKQIKPIITQNGLNLTSSLSQKGYQWYIDKIPIQGATNQTYLTEKSGDYSVLSSPEGCEASLSDQVSIIILSTEFDEITQKTQLNSFPNPVAKRAEIQFYLLKSSNLSLSLYNTDGRNIKSLFNGSYNSGWQKVIADFENLTEGVYFLVLKTEYGTATKRIMVIR